jgi:hypothetical protein
VRQANATFDFTVTGAVHDAFTYDASSSVTFATITVP